MIGLEIWNEQVLLRVSQDGRLHVRLTPDDKDQGDFELREGSVEPPGIARVTGLMHYAMPCIFEHLTMRLEGVSAPVMDRVTGHWPTAVVEDELDTYPYLHYLEERKTGTPWRLERWYTLAGPYLVFDSQQYFERSRPAERGRNWERLIIHLRQIAELSALAAKRGESTLNLVNSAPS